MWVSSFEQRNLQSKQSPGWTNLLLAAHWWCRRWWRWQWWRRRWRDVLLSPQDGSNSTKAFLVDRYYCVTGVIWLQGYVSEADTTPLYLASRVFMLGYYHFDKTKRAGWSAKCNGVHPVNFVSVLCVVRLACDPLARVTVSAVINLLYLNHLRSGK